MPTSDVLRKPLSPSLCRSRPTQTSMLLVNGIRDDGQAVSKLAGASIITTGEALGHGFWIDDTFLDQVRSAWPTNGLKARFTHPGLSADGLGSYLGRWTDPTIEANRVVADLQVSDLARNTPDGNLAEYVSRLAEEDPEAFGVSIVFEHDLEAEDSFEAENTRRGRFVSPDERNRDNLPHARLKRLTAGDLVDEPAANPDGLFHSRARIAQDAETLLDYALGATESCPQLSTLDVDAGRIRGFLSSYLDRHQLEIRSTAMSEETNEQEGQPTDYSRPTPAVEETPAVDEVKEEPEEEQATETETDETEQTEREDAPETTLSRTVQRFVSAFGDEALGYLSDGLSFEEATDRFVHFQTGRIEALEAENAELRAKLEQTASSGAAPVEFHASDDKRNGAGLAGVIERKMAARQGMN